MADINTMRTQFGSQVAAPPEQEWITAMIASGAGVLYNIWTGKIEDYEGGDYGDNYLLTEEGVIPLTTAAEEFLKKQTAGPLQSGGMPLFGLESDSIGFEGAFKRLGTTNLIDPGDELPPGVIKGIPEGADTAGYAPVGRSVGFGDTGKGQGGWFIKVFPTGKPPLPPRA